MKFCSSTLQNTVFAGLALAALTTFLPVGTAETADAQVKIAVVDLQRALNETDDGRKAKAQLKKIFKKKQSALDSKQKTLKKMKDEIESQKDVLSKDALRKKLEAYQKLFVELQSTYVEYQRELSKQEGQRTSKIIDRMQKILRHVGQQKGYTLIVERNEGGVIWTPSNLDLTDELIQRYNKGEGK